MFSRSQGIIALWLIGIGLVFFVAGPSESFNNCIRDREHTDPYQTPQEKISFFVKAIPRSRLYAACVFVSANENTGAITGIAGVVVAFFTFTLWLSTHRLWKAGEKQIAVAQMAAQAAENAVIESSKMLAHAKEVAERDLRPWLTIDAMLDSQVGSRYALISDEVSFFIKLNCTNIGRVAAQNIRYAVEAVDERVIGSRIYDWFNNLIERAVVVANNEGYYYTNALAPSERHTSQEWCRILKPEQESLWHQIPQEQVVYQIRIGIVVAYKTAGGSKVF
jgi:hypothetical protein